MKLINTREKYDKPIFVDFHVSSMTKKKCFSLKSELVNSKTRASSK